MKGRQDFRLAFSWMDADNSGELDYQEFAHALRVAVKLSALEVADLCQIFDSDGDGTIDFEEFLAFVSAPAGGLGRYMEDALQSREARRREARVGGGGARCGACVRLCVLVCLCACVCVCVFGWCRVGRPHCTTARWRGGAIAPRSPYAHRAHTRTGLRADAQAAAMAARLPVEQATQQAVEAAAQAAEVLIRARAQNPPTSLWQRYHPHAIRFPPLPPSPPPAFSRSGHPRPFS